MFSPFNVTTIKFKCVCIHICNPTGCSPPGPSDHGDSPGKNTGVGCHALPSRGSSQPRDQTQVSHIAGGFLTIWVTREAHEYWNGWLVSSSGDLPDSGIKPGSPALQANSLPVELPGSPYMAGTIVRLHSAGDSSGYKSKLWNHTALVLA